jgi:hypothetical protein
VSERRDEIVRPKNARIDQKDFHREREREMGMCGSVDEGDVKGGNGSCVEIDEDPMKTKGWKSLKEMKNYLRSEFEKRAPGWFRCKGGTFLHFAAYLGDVDATKMLIEDSAEVNAVDKYKYTALHWAAWHGHVDVLKVLLQNGADVNAVTGYKWTAIHHAAHKGHVQCMLQLLCFGAEIDEKAIKFDTTELLRPIEKRLKLLRDGKRMGTSLMSEEERRFMWNLAYDLAVKHPPIAFGTYRRIHAFVTFHGIFMVPGYGQVERKRKQWRCLIS